MTPYRITYQDVFARFDYRNDGQLIWRKIPTAAKKKGGVAGCLRKDGRVVIRFGDKLYWAHRLIYLWHHGWLPDEVDHHKGLSNQIDNLRAATHLQNMHNVGKLRTNTSGAKGVSWHKASRKWHARCYVNGHCNSVGYFDTVPEADAAVRKFREEHHGAFHNHG